jgi:carbamoyl-phosphate synthase large subunit
MKEIIVGVSGINAVDNPGPGVGIARSLKENTELKVKVMGLAYDAMEPGIYMDWLIDKAFITPYPSGSHTEFLQRLYHIKDTYGLDLIIPNLDAELPLYIRYSSNLEKKGIKTFLPTATQFRLRGKDRLQEVAKNIGIKFPESVIVTSYDELGKAVDKLGLPVMVKGAFYKAYRAYTTQEAISHYNAIVAEWGYPVIVQKVVSGEEMNVVAVGDGEGSSLGMLGIKKMWITSLGKIWTGVTIKNEPMLAAANKFIEAYRWRGGFELECIVKEDEVYLIEINPRLPAWSYFATGVGINLPANIVRRVFDLPVSVPEDYPTGKLYVRYTYELITDMDPFREITMKGER